MRIIIIGGSFAGISCALEAKKLYPEAQVTVLEQQGQLGFVPSGLNLYLNEEIDRLDQAVFIEETEVRKQGIDLHLNTYVTAIDPETQEVRTHSLLTPDQDQRLTYDRLVLAMGSSQTSPLVEEMNDPRILSTKQLVAAKQAADVLEDAQFIGVIGGGQIGIEATEALINANKQVVLFEQKEDLLSRYFDEPVSDTIRQAIELTGVELYLGEPVREIETTTQELTIMTDEQELMVDAIILGVDLIPQSQLVADWLPLHKDQTVVVNDYFQTEIPEIFAIGDLVQSYYQPTQSDQFIALVNNAVRSGQIAALNLKEPTVKRHRSLRVLGSRIFSQYVISIGLTESEIEEEVQTITLSDHYSLTQEIPVNLSMIVRRCDGVILGAQMYSEANILNDANLLSLVIGQEMTDAQLAFQDRLYYPRQTSSLPLIYRAALTSFEQRMYAKE